MGLSEPRKRMKLSHDPNNTKWTRDTGGFGHKIMTAQGWQPGEYLGAKDAAHAEFHTAANASHIRVLVKDDNLGLGAKKGSGLAEGECTGLDAFQALLGRLNGKDEDELQKEQKSREDLKRAIYSERKWGSVRFVKGGFLIGDKIQKLIDDEAERIRLVAGELTTKDADTSMEEDSSKVKTSKKKRVEKVHVEVVASEVESTEDSVASEHSRLENSKEKSKKKSKINLDEEDRAVRKAAKKARKQERALRREARSNEHAVALEVPIKKKRKSKPADVTEPTLSDSPSSTPESPPSTPRHFAGNRHAVRARFIAHKKLAHIDNVALDQIFMIKRP